MANKKLRSLILENFPLELRVKIDLLSRRRDIANKEKQQEIFKLLREFNINNVVPLGPGTNRYAFKINGYVVKVATDNDGKIDNFKEFKMSKRLYPYTIKVYEVASNGTLLVAEYIQPFQSYAEMLKYSDQIREILNKLSNVYLIGDVGITAKNYANWGLRIGTNNPVCLDFAYVYEVKSELFVCTNCGGMLSPNRDYNELLCPNPGCGRKYLFEDIRRKLGNDIHKHEIGDLTKEGYLLRDSNIDTELTPSRSGYLESKKPKKCKNKKNENEDEIEEYKGFVFNDKEEIKMKNTTIRAIATSMANNTFLVNGKPLTGQTLKHDEDIAVVPAKATVVNEYSETTAEVVDPECNIPDSDDASDNSLAFSAKLLSPEPKPIAPVVEAKEVEENNNHSDKVLILRKEADKPAAVPETVPNGEDEVEPVSTETEAEPPVVEESEEISEDIPEDAKANGGNVPELAVPKNEDQNNINFPIQRAISKLANMLGDFVYKDALFDNIRSNISAKKYFAGNFKDDVSRSIFRSLTTFLGVKEIEKDGKKEWIMEETVDNETLMFIHEFWNRKILNSAATSEEFKNAAKQCNGKLDQKVFLMVEDRLKAKMPPASDTVFERILEYLTDICQVIPEEEEHEEVRELTTEELVDAIFEETDANVSHDRETDSLPDETSNAVEVDEDDEDDEETDDDDDEIIPISVLLYRDDYGDIIKINYQDEYGVNIIPIYCKNIDAAVVTEEVNNNKWDWLTFTMPLLVFSTKDWQKYSGNEIEDAAKFSCLSTTNGKSLVGVYDVQGFYEVTEDALSEIKDEITIIKICSLINDHFKDDLDNYHGRLMNIKLNNGLTVVEESELLEYINTLNSEEAPTEPAPDAEASAPKFTPVKRGTV